jgi:hypothetical protein
MQHDRLRRILSSLNKDSFNHLIYEMWRTDNVDQETSHVSLKKMPRLGDGVFEQRKIRWEDPGGAKSAQAFNLVVPFYTPIELLLSTSDIKLSLTREAEIARRYNLSIKRRSRSWYWPQDGQFSFPRVQFVSNISGIDKQDYLDNILPKLDELLRPYDFLDGVEIGTYDSFLDQVPDKTLIALKSLLSHFQPETSLSWSDGKIHVQRHIVEHHLRSGVLPRTFVPCDTVITKPFQPIDICTEFEELINQKSRESDLEQFLKKHFKEIFGNHYDRVETQIWLRFPELDISNKNRRLDIFLRNAIERDWELVELKRDRKIISNYRDMPMLSATIQQSISQLKNYQKILQQSSVKRAMHQQGIEYYEPQLRLVIGGKPDISVEQWRRIKSENENGLRITTYQDLLQEMKFRYLDYAEILNYSKIH